MVRWLVGRVVVVPVRVLTAIRRRPLRSALIATVAATLIAGGVVFGVWRYAVGRWEAAQAAIQSDRPQDARPHLAYCLQIWPSSPDVHLLAARAARLTGEYDVAEAHLNRCLELQHGSSEAVQLEFLLLRAQGGEVDALAPTLFDLVNKGHADSAAILETIARAYIVRLRYKPASACLTKWIEMEPTNAKPYQLRGWALERLNNHTAARDDYHRAIELDPGLVPSRLRIVEMLLEDKQAPEAEPHLAILTRLAPDDPQVRSRLGICRFLQGDAEEARRLLESTLPQLSNDPVVLVTLANLELQDQRPVEAERWLRAVLANDAADTEALFVLVSALQLQGRAEEADEVLADYKAKKEIVETINKFLKEKADDPTATAAEYAEVGSLFLQIGRDKLGVYWLKKGLERDPQCQPAHRALAEYYERKGDADAAADHRSQIRGSPPPGPTAPPAGGTTPDRKQP